MKRLGVVLGVLMLLLGPAGTNPVGAAGGSLTIVSPTEGQKITTTDIPVQVQVSSFSLSAADVGLPDKEGEGHIHVMVDGMNMGVLFNFYTTPSFTLPGAGLTPGKHNLIFDLATNTHMDMPDTVKQVTIDYQPATPKPLPAAAAVAGPPEVTVQSPADNATVGAQFTMQVNVKNLTTSTELEGKQNVRGFGHLHVFVDMDMSGMNMPGGMMSMAGMVLMPGTTSFPLDLRAWSNGRHTITVEPVQNDHSPIDGGKPGMITVNLTGAAPAAAQPAPPPAAAPAPAAPAPSAAPVAAPAPVQAPAQVPARAPAALPNTGRGAAPGPVQDVAPAAQPQASPPWWPAGPLAAMGVAGLGIAALRRRKPRGGAADR